MSPSLCVMRFAIGPSSENLYGDIHHHHRTCQLVLFPSSLHNLHTDYLLSQGQHSLATSELAPKSLICVCVRPYSAFERLFTRPVQTEAFSARTLRWLVLGANGEPTRVIDVGKVVVGANIVRNPSICSLHIANPPVVSLIHEFEHSSTKKLYRSVTGEHRGLVEEARAGLRVERYVDSYWP